ncbi:MAG: DUF4147 domain-containing protein [Balneolaceae bacterium]|nr:DUF4147 domain-containing protein [Balneolaceae bacterium]
MKETLKAQQNILRQLVDQYTEGELLSIDMEDYLSEITLKDDEKVWVLGAGKAAVEMAAQVESYFPGRIKDGVVIAPQLRARLYDIQVFRGAHPIPDNESVAASYELIHLAKRIPDGDTVIFCLSGGASSLFCIPPERVELVELQETWKLLLESGADIHQINVVRKHISESSGGRLGRILEGTNLVSIILSDVPGNWTDTIGSGPVSGDSSTFKEAFQILKKHGLWNRIPHTVRMHISAGMYGDIPETPIEMPVCHIERVIPGAGLLARNAGRKLKDEGYHVWIREEAYSADVKKIAKEICEKAIGILSNKDVLKKPAALVFYGESTVHVKGNGLGGRNQELALITALSLEGQQSVSMLSLATDGVDGPTDAAGAIVNSLTTLEARKKKISPEDYLTQNDSYHFHQELGTLLKTGPTGNNVMDLQLVLVE